MYCGPRLPAALTPSPSGILFWDRNDTTKVSCASSLLTPCYILSRLFGEQRLCSCGIPPGSYSWWHFLLLIWEPRITGQRLAVLRSPVRHPLDWLSARWGIANSQISPVGSSSYLYWLSGTIELLKSLQTLSQYLLILRDWVPVSGITRAVNPMESSLDRTRGQEWQTRSRSSLVYVVYHELSSICS